MWLLNGWCCRFENVVSDEICECGRDEVKKSIVAQLDMVDLRVVPIGRNDGIEWGQERCGLLWWRVEGSWGCDGCGVGDSGLGLLHGTNKVNRALCSNRLGGRFVHCGEFKRGWIE